MRVYPKSSYESARRDASRLLTNADIAAEIQQRITENAMSADEVLARLGDHARGSMGDFVQVIDNKPMVDFQSASDNDRLHLVKKLKTKTRTYVKSGDEDSESFVNEVDVEFELYDAQSALEKLGKHHKLFTDKTEIGGDPENPITVDHFVRDMMDRIYGDTK